MALKSFGRGMDDMPGSSPAAGGGIGPGGLTAFIDQGSEFEGKLSFKDTARIDGSFRGEIASENTLIVGESGGARLTAFDIAADGSLSNRRSYAGLEGGAVPDGICLDVQGGIWVASPTTFEFLRVLEGGGVTDRIPAGEPAGKRKAIACMLGGPQRRSLFLISSVTMIEGAEQARTSRIDVVEVDIPGAGRP